MLQESDSVVKADSWKLTWANINAKLLLIRNFSKGLAMVFEFRVLFKDLDLLIEHLIANHYFPLAMFTWQTGLTGFVVFRWRGLISMFCLKKRVLRNVDRLWSTFLHWRLMVMTRLFTGTSLTASDNNRKLHMYPTLLFLVVRLGNVDLLGHRCHCCLDKTFLSFI
jgi:hypothetical protein